MSDELEPPFPDDVKEPIKALKPKRVPASKIELTDTQKDIIRAQCDKLDLKDLICEVYANTKLDISSPEGVVVREFMATLDPTAPAPPKQERKKVTSLTAEQNDNIRALLEQDDPPTIKETVKLLFGDIQGLTPLHTEYRLVHAAYKRFNDEAIDIWEEPVETRRYKPPLNYSQMIGMCNRYVGNAANPSKALYDPANMKKSHETNLKALVTYMQSSNCVLQASQYQFKADRELFESTFIRQTQDKAADLTPEEVDVYISIAAETVQISQLERNLQRQQRLLDSTLDGMEDKDGSKAKLSMSLVESVKALLEKLDKSKLRKDGFIKNVAGTRAKRLESQLNQNDSLVNLITMWVEEKTRADLLAMGKKEHLDDEKEFDRLSTLDETWALMAGMTRQEAIYGIQ